MTEPGPFGGPSRQTGSGAGSWSAEVSRATQDELHHLAFHGHAEHVRALFDTLTPGERARQTDPEILRQVALGSVARLRALADHSVSEQRRERDCLEGVVGLFVSSCRSRGVFPRELFRTLLDWIDELIRASRLSDAAAVCDFAVVLGASAFPDIAPWIQLRKARIQVLLGDVEAAYATLLQAYRRLDRIADRSAIASLLDALGTVSLETGRAPLFRRLLVERLRVFHTNTDERRAVVQLMRLAHGGALRLLVNPELQTTDKALWLIHWTCLSAARHSWRPVARLLETIAAGSAYLRQYGLRRNSAGAPPGMPIAIEATLVTRAMGGLGDLLMMTPGLHALRMLRPRRPLVLAIPRRFFPLFDGNADVQLLDIDDDFDPSTYTEWLNLTDCPAARVESRTAPAVRANRIELFARGLGITGSRLKAMDRRPRYALSGDEVKWRDEFFAAHGQGDAAVVGVQPRTEEAYRDIPHMRQIVEALAAEWPVLVFGTVLPAGVAHAGVTQVQGLDLRHAFALASGCTVLVTPDSVFFHLAGALDLPCVGLFGPTDGRVRGHDYPRARILDARPTLPCVPCWRNEVTPCALTGLRTSACLGAIDVGDVVRAVRQASARTARRLRVAG